MEKAMLLSGYGVNSEMETQAALKRAGMDADIVHINDLIDKRARLSDYRLLVFPGGFSYADNTGAGNAYANRVRNNVWDEVLEFLDGDNLVLGICNGFQVIANLGLVPAFDKRYRREVALLPNTRGVLECRFVTLKPSADNLWTNGIERLYCPVAHGEGNFFCGNPRKLEEKNLVCFKYVKDDLSPANGEYPFNPNGSMEDIAGIVSEDGKVLGLMPHLERALEFTNSYDWALANEILKREGKTPPFESPNMQFFRNIAKYFK